MSTNTTYYSHIIHILQRKLNTISSMPTKNMTQSHMEIHLSFLHISFSLELHITS